MTNQQALLKNAIENYPFDVGTHLLVCIYKLPRWGGSAREAGAYLNSVANLLPEPQADIVYLRVALNLYRRYDSAAFESGDGGLSSSRVMRSIVTLIEYNELNSQDAETFIQLAIKLQRSDLATKVAEYHAKRFPLSQFPPESVEHQALLAARKAIDKP